MIRSVYAIWWRSGSPVVRTILGMAPSTQTRTQTLRLRRVVARYCAACKSPFSLTTVRTSAGWHATCTTCGRTTPLARSAI